MSEAKKNYNTLRTFRKWKSAEACAKLYGLTVYEIHNTSYKREYQGRMATKRQYTLYFDFPIVTATPEKQIECRCIGPIEQKSCRKNCDLV